MPVFFPSSYLFFDKFYHILHFLGHLGIGRFNAEILDTVFDVILYIIHFLLKRVLIALEKLVF